MSDEHDGLDNWRERMRARMATEGRPAPFSDPDGDIDIDRVRAELTAVAVTLGKVEPGTVITITLPHLELLELEGTIREVRDEIAAKCGHENFVLLVGEPDMDVEITPCEYAAATFSGLAMADALARDVLVRADGALLRQVVAYLRDDGDINREEEQQMANDLEELAQRVGRIGDW